MQNVPDISKWNTCEAICMNRMFYYCIAFSSVPDISNWNTSNITDMNEMFCNYCQSLKKMPDISKWNTEKCTMEKIFDGCPQNLYIVIDEINAAP